MAYLARAIVAIALSLRGAWGARIMTREELDDPSAGPPATERRPRRPPRRRAPPSPPLPRDSDKVSGKAALRIHATSFNAGNQAFRNDASFKDLLSQLSKGHETADIVFMGFQELDDSDHGFAEMARRSLWRSTSQTQQTQINKDLEGMRRAVWERHPNLKYTEEGQSTMPAFARSFDLSEDAGKRRRKLELRAEHVDVTMESATFKEGLLCRAAKHFDTTMYAFVSPWSNWRIRHEPYSSRRCKPSPSGRGGGCTLDNNARGECGKVVNLLVFHATRGDAGIRFCALNTHMSFSGEAETRMRYVADAVAEAEAAGCDSLAFVGDFNSRLHCQGAGGAGGAARATLPVYEMSMDYVLDFFDRKGGRGHSPAAGVDELAQMLANKEVSCFERKKSKDGKLFKKKAWREQRFSSTLAGRGLVEAPVSFGPTYKLAPKSKAQKAKFHRCVGGMKKCYANPGGEGKHNPAWTDRVLAQGGDRASVEFLLYERRDISEDFKSDHLPVVAQVAIIPN